MDSNEVSKFKQIEKRNRNILGVDLIFECINALAPLLVVKKLTQSPFQITAQIDGRLNVVLIVVIICFVVIFARNFYKAYQRSEHKKILKDFLRALFLVHEIVLGVILTNLLFSIQFNHVATQYYLCGWIIFILLRMPGLKKRLGVTGEV